jgi:hypothetical protein
MRPLLFSTVPVLLLVSGVLLVQQAASGSSSKTNNLKPAVRPPATSRLLNTRPGAKAPGTGASAKHFSPPQNTQETVGTDDGGLSTKPVPTGNPPQKPAEPKPKPNDPK